MPTPRTLTGAAGEHFVMYRLLSMGISAGLAPLGADNIDIIISDAEGSRLAAIQVKTSSTPVTSGWQMSRKQETLASDQLFYCFVAPPNRPRTMPSCWIVPSSVVANHLSTTHQTWLSNPPRRGDSRRDSDRRKFHTKFVEPGCAYPEGWLNQYLEAWHLLPPNSTPPNYAHSL